MIHIASMLYLKGIKTQASTVLPALFFLALALFPISNAYAGQVKVAVAANFSPVIKQLKPEFEAKSGHQLITSVGSTGTLYSQIKNDAPYDIFLSADKLRSQQLIADNLAIKNSYFIYAIGQLVLWSQQPELIDKEGKILTEGGWKLSNIHHIAISNPDVAPYGLATTQMLESLGIKNNIYKKIVTGQNINQTFQFVASGNAQMGFLSLSQVLSLAESKRGSLWIIPENLYIPIEQSAVLLTRGQNNRAAKDFLDFLKSPKALSIINALGYRTERVSVLQESDEYSKIPK